MNHPSINFIANKRNDMLVTAVLTTTTARTDFASLLTLSPISLKATAGNEGVFACAA